MFKNCEFCNKKYFRYPSTYKRSRFCSMECKYKGIGKIFSKQRIGKNNPAWKGGKIRVGEYIKISSPSHPYCDIKGYVFKHRLVIEKKLRRYLLPIEVVHHINNNKKDNRLINLMIFPSTGEHTAHHHSIRRIMNRGKK